MRLEGETMSPVSTEEGERAGPGIKIGRIYYIGFTRGGREEPKLSAAEGKVFSLGAYCQVSSGGNILPRKGKRRKRSKKREGGGGESRIAKEEKIFQPAACGKGVQGG